MWHLFYKICSFLKGRIQRLKKTCHGSQRLDTHERKRAIANMQSDHVANLELRYFLAQEIGERFQLIDIYTFRHFKKIHTGNSNVNKYCIFKDQTQFIYFFLVIINCIYSVAATSYKAYKFSYIITSFNLLITNLQNYL